jgi:hypothetical protein
VRPAAPQGNIKTVNKYMAEKLCRIPVEGVRVRVATKDQSTRLNHKSTVSNVLTS